MALSAQDLEAKREEVIAQFEQYRDQVMNGMDSVIAALRKGEYASACEIMSTLSQHQGQASVRMRAVLVKQGFIVRERENG